MRVVGMIVSRQGSYNDIIIAGDGNDLIIDDLGKDTVNGGLGVDVNYFDEDFENLTLSPISSLDIIWYHHSLYKRTPSNIEIFVGNGRAKAVTVSEDMRDGFFDEAFYLQHNADIDQAVEAEQFPLLWVRSFSRIWSV